MSQKFRVINESFKCLNCDEINPLLAGSCRNHCRNCLFSLHVDEKHPGDRLSNCHCLMIPAQIEQNGKKGFMLIHQCQKCGKIIKNKTAADDNFDLIIRLVQNTNFQGRNL